MDFWRDKDREGKSPARIAAEDIADLIPNLQYPNLATARFEGIIETAIEKTRRLNVDNPTEQVDDVDRATDTRNGGDTSDEGEASLDFSQPGLCSVGATAKRKKRTNYKEPEPETVVEETEAAKAERELGEEIRKLGHWQRPIDVDLQTRLRKAFEGQRVTIVCAKHKRGPDILVFIEYRNLKDGEVPFTYSMRISFEKGVVSEDYWNAVVDQTIRTIRSVPV